MSTVKHENSNESSIGMKVKGSSIEQISIDNRYFIKSVIAKCGDYNMYRGVDSQMVKWINLYGKRADNNLMLSSKVKETLRNQICPKVLWSGQLKLSKALYFFEVHEKYGPSMRCMFETTKRPPNEKEVLHLLFQMIKLVQKMNNIKIVCGELDLDQIVFDANPKKNQLYMLNCFKLRKKNQYSKTINTKYCSRGAHLGRKITTKDDLESICYILIDLFRQGLFLNDKASNQYQQVKLSLKIDQFGENLPRLFVDFYHYVISLNYNDEINFFYWKSYLTKLLTVELLSKPYGFLLCKGDTKSQLLQDSKCDYTLSAGEYDIQIKEFQEEQEQETIIRLRKMQKNISMH